MGKGLSLPSNLSFARAASEGIKRSHPALKPLASPKDAAPSHAGMENSERRDGRLPLAEVVSDCVRRWFQDTLKEARAGDSAMQVLVGQMYQSGYGVARNEQKAKIDLPERTTVDGWTRSSWKVLATSSESIGDYKRGM